MLVLYHRSMVRSVRRHSCQWYFEQRGRQEGGHSTSRTRFEREFLDNKHKGYAKEAVCEATHTSQISRSYLEHGPGLSLWLHEERRYPQPKQGKLFPLP